MSTNASKIFDWASKCWDDGRTVIFWTYARGTKVTARRRNLVSLSADGSRLLIQNGKRTDDFTFVSKVSAI